jgi:glycosyltransferase involved in cell wall biosynthesis
MNEPSDMGARAAARAREGISVFFPAYNDEASIAALVRDALEVLPQITDDYEVVVVNDGSADRTGEVLDALARANQRVRVVHHETNRGYGGALRTGFASASKELVFYTDGDGQYDVRELVGLRPLLTEGVDIVNGYKLKRADKWRRRALGAVYNRLTHILFSIPIRDVDCDFRLMRACALRKVALSSTSGSICVELVYKLHRAGCKFTEAPVNHYPRAHGSSQFFRPSRVARTALDLWSLWTNLVILNRRDWRQQTAATEKTPRGHTSSER